MEEENAEDKVCKKCNGTGIVKEKGSCHTCWDCLDEGRLNQHSKKLPETRFKL